MSNGFGLVGFSGLHKTSIINSTYVSNDTRVISFSVKNPGKSLAYVHL